MANGKMKLSLLLSRGMFARTFAPDAVEKLYSFANVMNPERLPETVDAGYVMRNIIGAEAAITCWGTPKITGPLLEAGADLKLIAHGAGTPKAIIEGDAWARGVRVFTAAPVIAADVAETALWGIIDLQKHMKEFDAGMRSGGWFENLLDLKSDMRRLNYRLTAGVVSASRVGRNMIRLLQVFGVKVLLYDPMVSPGEAAMMGVTLAGLEELMASCDVVTVHTPSLPETRGLIGARLLSALRDGAVFVNTSRGAVVDEKALTEELKTGRISAYLDVFEQEPLPLDSELYKLGNVRLSPHMSGGHTVNGGYERGDYLVEQLYSWKTTGALRDEVTPAMMAYIA